MARVTWKYPNIVFVLILISGATEAVEIVLHPTATSGVQGTVITLQCAVNTEFQTGVHRLYWAFYGTPGQHTFLSVDRSIYSSLEPSKRNRYSIIGGLGLGEIEFSLRISNAQVEDNGVYECILYDPFTGQRIKTPEPARVVVLPLRPPDRGYPECRIAPPKPKPGTMATFTCITSGGLPRPTLTWTKQNTLLTAVLNSTEDEGLEILTFTRYISTWDNNATFVCSAESPAMKDSRNCSVTPFEAHIRVKVTSLQTVKVGQSAEFICTASGVPEVNRYRWFVGRGDTAERISKSHGRYTVSSQGTFLRIKDVTEKDNGTPVRCVARNQLDIKGVDEGILRVIALKPTANVAFDPITKGLLTTPLPVVTTRSRDSYDYGPTKHVNHAGADNAGGKFDRFPERPFPPKPSSSSGFFTAKPDGHATIKQRAFNRPMVTYQIHNNGLEKVHTSSKLNMTHLVGGATGLLLIVLIVFVILIVVVRRSQSSRSKTPPLRSARARNLRPVSTGTLSKSDIVVLPVPTSEDEETDMSKPVGADGITTVKLISLEKAATLEKPRARAQSTHQDLMSQLKGTLRSRNTYMNFFENEAVTKTFDRSTSNSSDISEGEIVRCDSAFCDDFKPGLSGSETALNETNGVEAKFSKAKSSDFPKSAGTLVYAELDFGKSKQTTAVKGGEDKTHYAEIRMSRDVDL